MDSLTVSERAYNLAVEMAAQWKMLLFTVTPALTGALVFFFLRLTALSERAIKAHEDAATSNEKLADAVKGMAEAVKECRK